MEEDNMEVVCLILLRYDTFDPSYDTIPILFAYFFGFDIPTSSSFFIENVIYYSCNNYN